MWGIRLTDVQTMFGDDFLYYLHKQAEGYLRRGLLVKDGDVIRLSRDGIFVSDGIMSDLLRVWEKQQNGYLKQRNGGFQVQKVHFFAIFEK